MTFLDALTLDVESRVVSRETESRFSRFSCVSLVGRVVRVLAPLDVNAEDSLAVVIWPSLAGVEFIVLALARVSDAHRPAVVNAVCVLYRADLDHLSRHIAFPAWLTPDDAPLVLEALCSVAERAGASLFEHLPPAFAECLPRAGPAPEAVPVAGPAFAVCAARARDARDHSDVADLAPRLYQALVELDERLADAFGFEVLRWAVCYGDLPRATLAVRAFAGFLFPAGTIVVGLFARVLWILSDALAGLPSEAVAYFAAVHRALVGVANAQTEAGMVEADSALFWMAAECLHCTAAAHAPVFEAAMEVVLLHVNTPALFVGVAHPSPFARGQSTDRVFWKFHQT
jgi:hypothetical protein